MILSQCISVCRFSDALASNIESRILLTTLKTVKLWYGATPVSSRAAQICGAYVALRPVALLLSTPLFNLAGPISPT